MHARGVSPVVGLILLILIVIILGSFVALLPKGLVEKAKPAPVTALDVEIYRDAVVVKHAGGDPFNIRFAKVKVTMPNRISFIKPFLENWLSRDVMMEIGDEKALMYNECTFFRPFDYGEVEVFWKDKIMYKVAKSTINEYYSPSFLRNYSSTLRVDSVLGVIADENGIVATACNYPDDPPGLIMFLDELGNVNKAYQGRYNYSGLHDLPLRDVAKASSGYLAVGLHHVLKVDNSGNLQWVKYYGSGIYRIYSISCSGDVCAIVGEYSGHIRIALIDSNDGNYTSNITSLDLTGTSDRVIKVGDGWLVVGRTSTGNGFSALFDNNLNPVFVKYYTNVNVIRNGVEVKNGYILTGSANSDILVMRIDKNGNVLWAKRYNCGVREEGYSIYCDKSSEICTVVGHSIINGYYRLVVLKVDGINGRLISSKVYGFDNTNAYFDVVKPVYDKLGRFRGFVGGGRIGDEPMIVRINVEGEIWGCGGHLMNVKFSESSFKSSAIDQSRFRSIKPAKPNDNTPPNLPTVSLTSHGICLCYR